ncbi:hypothetical protein ACFL17_10090 [Pseudomonadota bacterium]
MVMATALVGTGCSLNFGPSIEELAKKATALLRHPELAKQIGQQYLEQLTVLSKPNQERLVSEILAGTGIDPNNASYFSLLDLEDELTAKVRMDFTLERIVKVNGWVLSATEAQLCALLAIVAKV